MICLCLGILREDAEGRVHEPDVHLGEKELKSDRRPNNNNYRVIITNIKVTTTNQIFSNRWWAKSGVLRVFELQTLEN